MITAFFATTGITLLLYLTGLFVVFTPLPVSLAVVRRKGAVAFLASASALVLLIALYWLPSKPLMFLPMMIFYPSVSILGAAGLGAFYFLYYLILGWTMALLSRKTAPWTRLEPLVALITVVGLALPVAGLFLFAQVSGLSLMGDLAKGIQDLFLKMIELQKAAGVSDDDLAFLKSSAPLIATRFFQIVPALWVDMTLAVVSLNILLLRRWTPQERLFPNWPDFGQWRLPEAWIWAPIFAGATYFLNDYLLQSIPLGVVALNVLIVAAAICFFQGLAVGSFFFRTKLSPMLRLLGYALFFLFFQFVALAVMGVGLADFWFDFRKLKKVS